MNESLFDIPTPHTIAIVPCIEHQQRSVKGRMKMEGKAQPIGRAMFCIHHKLSLDDVKHMSVIRACRNPRCIELSHLFLWPTRLPNPVTKGEHAEATLIEKKKADGQRYLYPEWHNVRVKDYVR